MDNKPRNSGEYLKTRVLTASAEQLQLMLYEGAIRFCEQARTAIEAKQIEHSYNLLAKAEKVVMELCNSMKEDVAPDVCTNMRRLYLFCYDRLIRANLEKKTKPLDEALQVLRHLRETWIMLMEKLKTERAVDASPTNVPDPSRESDDLLTQEIGATVNFRG